MPCGDKAMFDRMREMSLVSPSLSYFPGPNNRADVRINLAKERADRIDGWNKKILKISNQLIWNDYAQSTRIKKRNQLMRLLELWKSEQ